MIASGDGCQGGGGMASASDIAATGPNVLANAAVGALEMPPEIGRAHV